MRLEIDETRLGLLFPAHIIVDRDLVVRHCGPSLARQMVALTPGQFLLDHFHWMGGGGPEAIADLAADGRAIQLNSLCGRVRLTGSVLAIEQGYLCALRNVPSEFLLGGNDLQMSDFSPDDPAVAGMMLVGLQKAMLDESREVTLELARERQRSLGLLERLSRLSGFMAHDFNNFLSIIRLNCDRLAKELGDQPKQGRLVGIIRETALRGSEITRSLMTLSRQRNDSRLPIVVDDLIRENLAFFRTVTGAKVDVEIHLGAGDREVEVSRVGILNSLINLLINARDAMPHGGTVSIATAIRDAMLELPGDPQPPQMRSYLAVEVADTGAGMTEEALSHAFEPLFSTKTQGNGIGLASVLEFAREMGGDACLDSRPGHGARIYIYLPTMDDSIVLPAEIPLQPPAPVSTDEARILLVEDEPYALEALTEMLEAEGYAVTPCASCAEAAAALEKQTFRILLSDIILPGESGPAFARKACEALPQLKVILMSGYVPEAEELHADWMFIRKPMDTQVLLTMLQASLKAETHA